MATPSIGQYYQNRREQGYTDDQIIAELVQSGWSREIAQEQIRALSSPMASPVTPSTNGQQTMRIGANLGSRALKLYMKKLLPLLLSITAVYALIYGINQLSGKIALSDSPKALQVTVQIALLLVVSFIVLIFDYYIVLILGEQPHGFRNKVILSIRRALPYWALGWITALAVLGGLVLVVFPGLIMASILFAATFHYIREQTSISQAIQKSYLYSYGKKKRISLLLLPVAGIIILYIVLITTGMVSFAISPGDGITGLVFFTIGMMALGVFVVTPYCLCYLYLLSADLQQSYREGVVPERRKRFFNRAVVSLAILGLIVFVGIQWYTIRTAVNVEQQYVTGEAFNYAERGVLEYYRIKGVFPDRLADVDKYYSGFFERTNKLWGERDWELPPISSFEYAVGSDKKDYKICIEQKETFMQTEPGKECHTRGFVQGNWRNDTPEHRDSLRAHNIVNIHGALNRYYEKNGKYPSQLLELIEEVDVANCGQYGCQTVGYFDFEDPKTLQFYDYLPASDRSSYEICVTYEVAGLYGTGRECERSERGKRIYSPVPFE